MEQAVAGGGTGSGGSGRWEVGLVPWSEEDFPLLVAGNSEEMTAHLGGPESAEALAARHRQSDLSSFPPTTTPSNNKCFGVMLSP